MVKTKREETETEQDTLITVTVTLPSAPSEGEREGDAVYCRVRQRLWQPSTATIQGWEGAHIHTHIQHADTYMNRAILCSSDDVCGV